MGSKSTHNECIGCSMSPKGVDFCTDGKRVSSYTTSY